MGNGGRRQYAGNHDAANDPDPQNTETTELPESLKALLAYDRDLLSNYNMPVIETLQRSIDK
ncbi:DUF5066 family protein, partial [Salmonella enterica subsp. enterica serovar Kentucky]|nr:DUF5066 family protein [Salmonella enterica subsp. enterica serovar Kentucky]